MSLYGYENQYRNSKNDDLTVVRELYFSRNGGACKCHYITDNEKRNRIEYIAIIKNGTQTLKLTA